MKIDIHAHVLPGVDHGARDWDMSLKMLVKSAQCGVNEVIATPHYLPWKKGVTGKVIQELCEEAEQRLKKEYGISLDIHPGNEIYYSTETVDMLKEGKALTLAGSRYVLVEFEPEVTYTTLCRAVRELSDSRYIPIFAHIERYLCLNHNEKLAELKSMGAHLQVNIGSIQGGLFDSTSRKTKQWLSEGFIDFLASDMHDLKERPPMSNEALQWVQKKLNSQYRNKIFYDNAKKILAERKA